MKEFFDKWLSEYPDPYPQRYRRQIPYQWVKNNGTLLMTLDNGEVAFPRLDVVTAATSISKETDTEPSEEEGR